MRSALINRNVVRESGCKVSLLIGLADTFHFFSRPANPATKLHSHHWNYIFSLYYHIDVIIQSELCYIIDSNTYNLEPEHPLDSIEVFSYIFLHFCLRYCNTLELSLIGKHILSASVETRFLYIKYPADVQTPFRCRFWPRIALR